MSLVYTFLLAGLAFAGLVLLLLSAFFIKAECCGGSKRNNRNSYFDEEEAEIIEKLRNNNDSERESLQTVETGTTVRLTSPASAPAFPTLPHDLPETHRTRRNTSTSSIEADISGLEIRAVQAGILRLGDKATPESLGCNLLIGVCATVDNFCGYCINLQDKWCEFYKIQTEHLPYQLVEQLDIQEMEMRNFFFALMLWADKIKDSKRFHIYTGSHSVNYDNNRLWRRAVKLLEHFTACEKVDVGNDCKHYINLRKDANSYALKIVPAEDLAEDNFDGFKELVSRYYGIPVENVKGSHDIMVS